MPICNRSRKAIGIAAALTAVLVVCAGGLIYEFIKPTNAADNASPTKRAEMLRITLSAADLAPLPASASSLKVRTEGSSFTRSFRVDFTAAPADIKKWLSASKGIKGSAVTNAGSNTRYVVDKPKDGFGHAEVTVDNARNAVQIYVCWS